MKAIVMRLRADGSREKVLVDQWPDPPAIAPDQFKTRTLLSGVTNGTERNHLMRGNYGMPDERLPMPYGYCYCHFFLSR